MYENIEKNDKHKNVYLATTSLTEELLALRRLSRTASTCPQACTINLKSFSAALKLCPLKYFPIVLYAESHSNENQSALHTIQKEQGDCEFTEWWVNMTAVSRMASMSISDSLYAYCVLGKNVQM